mgnify:CR=1 FL=1
MEARSRLSRTILRQIVARSRMLLDGRTVPVNGQAWQAIRGTEIPSDFRNLDPYLSVFKESHFGHRIARFFWGHIKHEKSY